MSQKIIEGIEPAMSLMHGKKILLVRDYAYEYLSVKDFFDEIPHVEFSDFTTNPLYEQVCEGIRLFKEEKCEIIVAVGGGSTIDVAKCIKLYCKMDSNVNYLQQEPFDTGITLIAVPTTAGTGSESTRHAVIYYEGQKQSISHISIIPDYAVLEYSVLRTLPDYQKKCTMMDALCQAIESWWSVNSTEESKGYSREAVLLIKENWQEYLRGYTSKVAGSIMKAANLSGQAINITATTAAHAMSYKLTSMYRLPHGHAVAICMPEVWKYILGHVKDCIDSRGGGYLEKTLDEISAVADLEWFCGVMEKLDMGYPVSDKKESDIKELVKSVNLLRLKNNPVALNNEILQEMYGRIVK